MSWIARSQLASAVSRAGGLGIIETGSGELDQIRAECGAMRRLTDQPYGLNIAIGVLRGHTDADILELIANSDAAVVTTSAGSPRRFTAALHDMGKTVLHVVGTLAGALKAQDAGVDGLIVEGVEGGGFKDPHGASTMVLLPLVRSRIGLPIVAAGGICDGSSMAAVFALGAEGVQLGTRMLATTESPVHTTWKQAVIDAAETDTVLLNRSSRPAMRALATPRSTELAGRERVGMEEFERVLDLYFGGDMTATIALGGQVMGRIDHVLPVAAVLETMIEEFRTTAKSMCRWAQG